MPKYAISVGHNQEWAVKTAKRIAVSALAFAHKDTNGKALIFDSIEKAQDYCDGFNGSYNQTKHALVVEI